MEESKAPEENVDQVPVTSTGDESVVWNPDQVREALKSVVDPELHINIVDLGLVYGIQVNEQTISVQMTLTSPGCPYGPYILHMVKETLLNLKGIEDANVQVVWEPMWGPDKMTEEVRLELGFDL